jgi:hypothetical protein
MGKDAGKDGNGMHAFLKYRRILITRDSATSRRWVSKAGFARVDTNASRHSRDWRLLWGSVEPSGARLIHRQPTLFARLKTCRKGATPHLFEASACGRKNSLTFRYCLLRIMVPRNTVLVVQSLSLRRERWRTISRCASVTYFGCATINTTKYYFAAIRK